ncbi:kinase-like domain-containing protein [Dactylonectria estremocensis]|uniref:Kinase-like domain-containing protein n=1 Tax=Dactylonectria estremocensis TaxID=1079267 RepID=A0A9P9DTM5_9HYPO|nr:kinase-like domain-containing protein [Dactylonectria estremocensis]
MVNLNDFRLLRRKDTNISFALNDRYLVVDLMAGGDLRFYISRNTFTKEAVGFWIAELDCALRYIHSWNIIHRDIKPDNVLLNADGHNVASDVIAGRTLMSKSGTLAYLASKVYARKGYDVCANWWSLGVLFYKCIYNKRPFICCSKGSLSLQIQTTSPNSALDPNRDTRMGSTWDSFANHEFFKVFDFELLEQKRIEPIFAPSDKTNFDATYDIEELLLEEAPLKARATRQKPRKLLKEDATDKEICEDELYRMIETDFRPFDYTMATYKNLTGGVQVPLDRGGSWLELARQDATLPTEANNAAEGENKGSGGMFGFLNSKKGRSNSLKPNKRGVLGKKGARAVIG